MKTLMTTFGAMIAMVAVAVTPAAARSMADEVHELHTRFERSIDKGFDAAGQYIERRAQERNSGCNSSSFGSRTRQALGC